MNENSFTSSVIQLVTLATTIGGLITQYLLNDYIKSFFKIDNSGNEDYLKAFSYGGLMLGSILILILFKYRFILTAKKYINKAKKEDYLKQLQEHDKSATNDLQEQNNEIKYSIKEPFYYTIQALGIVTFALSLAAFILIFVVPGDLLKSITYLFFVLLIVFTVTVYLLDLYNNLQRKITEKNVLKFIEQRIQSKFLPKITIIGQARFYTYNPPQIWVDFDVEYCDKAEKEKEFRAFVNVFEPEAYFEIQPRVKAAVANED